MCACMCTCVHVRVLTYSTITHTYVYTHDSNIYGIKIMGIEYISSYINRMQVNIYSTKN